MIKHKPHHKGFRRKTSEEIAAQAARRMEKSLERGIKPKVKNTRTSQHDIWEKEWKAEHRHITWCESCGRTGGPDPDSKLTMMHALKRNKIGSKPEDEVQYKRAAKVCWGEHRKYDEAQGSDVHERMAAFVDHLISVRL